MPITRQQFQFGASIAALSAIIGLLSATAGLYSQLSSIVEPYVLFRLKQDFAPIGTVVSSVLPPPLFAAATGEVEGDELKNRKWIIADGSMVLGTEYAKKTNNKPVPDLRGMFIRGIDPKGSRQPGEVQRFATARPQNAFSGTTDTAGPHTHPDGMTLNRGGERYNAGGSNYAVAEPNNTGQDGAHHHRFEVTEGGDEETRPTNVAVFYYIKIN